MKKMIGKLSKVLVVALIPIVLFSTNFLLLLSPYYIEWRYSTNNFPKPIELTERERNILSRSVLAYVKGITDVSCLEETDLFTQAEIQHLNDVRTLVNRVFLVRGTSFLLLVYFILFSVLSFKEKQKTIFNIFLGCLLTVEVSVILILLAFLNFNIIFNGIHQILFPVGTWSFGYNSVLIELYPEKFWIDSAFVFLILTLFEALIVGITIFMLMKKSERKKIKIDIKLNKRSGGNT